MSNDNFESLTSTSTPLSIFLRIPVLSETRGGADLLKSIRFFSDKPAMLSNFLHMPTLTKGSTTFSQWLGLPVSVSESGSLQKVLQNFTLAKL